MAAISDVIRGRIRELQEMAQEETLRIEEWDYRSSTHLGPGEYAHDTEAWERIRVGETWSRHGKTAFLRNRVTIPRTWAGKRVELELVTGGEGCLFLNEAPFQGIDNNHTRVLLAPQARGVEEFDFLLELKPGNPFEYVEQDKPFVLSEARLLAINSEVRKTHLDFQVAFEAALAVKDETLKQALFTAIKSALHEIDFRNPKGEAFFASLPSARAKLKEELSAIEFGRLPGRVLMAGHSHIDVAWLWPLKETVRKCSRTFSTVMRLMEQYPHYYFVQSQAQLYDYTRRYYPCLYEEIKKRVAEGRFEPIGGTWVENDTNLPSGESLVRQVLYGKRFFRREFGVDIKVGWLPDVFGYTWSLPQVYKKSGIEYFMTSKISWNDTNRFPYDTFYWQGVDGTKILTHFIPGTYNGSAKPDEVLLHWERYMQKLECPDYLYAFGYGDGGGGPTQEMLEYIPRMADLPGIPAAKTGRVHDFFERIAREARELPTWNGELYFELHRGTYTSQARNKRYNRKSELLYRDAEFLSAFAAGAGFDYPKETLLKGWHTILLNQFHDIIPGSSIGAVYRDSARDYEMTIADGKSVRKGALMALARAIDTKVEAGTPIIVFNTLSWTRTDITSLPLPGTGPNVKVVAPDGSIVPSQVKGENLLFVATNVPSMGYSVFRALPASNTNDEPLASPPFKVEGRHIITPYYEVELGEDGYISSIYDKTHDRDILPEGSRANVLQVFEDKPTRWEAWDVELQYQDKVWEFALDAPPEVRECGAVRLVLGFRFKYGSSTIEQEMVFYAHTRRIDFVTRVDWQERKTLLKVAFPVDVLSPRATYEIAYGTIERPTHWNTPWDKARFEVSGHKWADLSEGDYGVSLLNDCKYGWDIKDNVIRLSLLRSPESPDPHADRGTHEFTYSLFPHGGDWRNGSVREGYALNVPLLAMEAQPHEGGLPERHSFLAVDRPNVIIDAVKQAEEGDELIIRVYEAHGARGPVTLCFGASLRHAVECNLLEEDEKPVEHEGRVIRFKIKPYEIKTFRVAL